MKYLLPLLILSSSFAIFAQEIIDQKSKDICFKDATLTKEKISSSKYGGGDFKLSQCKKTELISQSPHMKRYKIDCTSNIEKIIHYPLAHRVVLFAGFYPNNLLATDDLDCNVGIINLISDLDAFENSSGIGFYFNGGKKVTRTKYLTSIRLDSEKVKVSFAFLARCWRGSATSSSRWSVTFKPFMDFADPYDPEVIYRNWDRHRGNYYLDEQHF